MDASSSGSYGQEGGRRRGKRRENKQGNNNKWRKGEGFTARQQRPANAGQPRAMMDMEELATADASTIDGIVRDWKIFKVDVGKWKCHQQGGGGAVQLTAVPKSVGTRGAAATCDVHFDPQTGKKCGKRARCFPSDLSAGVVETVKQRMDGVATRTYVRQNLDDPKRFGRFLSVFNDAATNVLVRMCERRSLTYGKDVVFAFKGGNVMRLVLSGLVDRLSPADREEWSDMMQIGDMDFEVYVADATDMMVRDVTVAMLYVLYAFRVFLEREGWVMSADREAYAATAEVLPAATLLTMDGHKAHAEDSIIAPYVAQEGCDMLYVPVRSVLTGMTDGRGKGGGKGGGVRWLETAARPDTPFSVAMNRSMSFGFVQKKGVPPEADIVLLRLKHNMNVSVSPSCSRRFSAEVIDVSIPTNKDRMHRIKGERKGTAWFAEYEFVIDGQALRIRAPSLANFVLDLHMFMFVLSEYPWYDAKSAKRMKRYAWFATMLRLQQGADHATVVSEISSTARALASMLASRLADSSSSSSSKRGGSTSLARRVSPWAELVSSIAETRTKAVAAGLGDGEWRTFVTTLRVILMAVAHSFSSIDAGAGAAAAGGMATVAAAASKTLSSATVPPRPPAVPAPPA